MAAKTNTQLLQEIHKELKGIKTVQTAQAKDLEDLKNWRLGIEIGKSAVEEYKQQEQADKDARQRREVLKQAGYVLGLVGLVLYVYLSSKGVHPWEFSAG